MTNETPYTQMKEKIISKVESIAANSGNDIAHRLGASEG
jgi:hypothetical protein